MNRRGFIRSTGAGGLSLAVNMSASADDVKEALTPGEVLEALWKAIRDHYPMLEFVGAYGDEWLEEFRPRVAAAKNLEQAYPLMDELVCRLRDYHTRFFWPGKPQLVPLPIRGHELREGSRTPVVVRKSAVRGIAPGDEIVSFNGAPVSRALKEAYRFAVGSTPEALSRNAVDRLLSAPRGATVKLQMRAGSSSSETQVELQADGYPETEPTVAHRSIDERTGCIRIPRWSGGPGESLPALFDAALEKYRAAPCLVIDVRGNGGGLDAPADSVTGRFIRKRVISSISFHRKAPTLEYARTIEWCEPRGSWSYGGRVAVLIDEGCASACEHFVSGMIGAGVYLAGMPTDGACGWTQRIGLPGGSVLFCSRTFPLHGGTPSPRHGLEPHVRTPLTRADLRSGRDAALERALRWLRSGDPLPIRRQPV